jgi:hypothetical protein
MERYKDPNRNYKPFEKHVAESRWQYCCCQSCQDKRFFLDSLPGPPIDYNTLRHKGENY